MFDNELHIGVVGIPGSWSSETLAASVAAKTGSCVLIDMTKVETCLSSGKVWFEGIDLTAMHAIIVKKINPVYSPVDLERLELLRYLQAQGVSIFSRPENIQRLISRLACTITLRNADIPMPETFITEELSLALEVVQKLGRVVLKPLFSTKARGMIIVNSSDDDKENKINDFHRANSVMYIQKVVNIPERDLGVVFLGGRYLATYARQGNDNSWNTTINSGGYYAAYEPSAEVIDLAKRAQAPFALDFTCVDVVETDDGPMVFEVSAFGGYRGLRDAHGIDAAGLYTDYVLDKLRASKT